MQRIFIQLGGSSRRTFRCEFIFIFARLTGLVKISYVECDEEYSMRGSVLQEMIDRDRQAGLIPFFVCATLGTTGSCSFDDLEVIGHICELLFPG